MDEVILLRSAMLSGAHLEGQPRGRRLGGGAANTGVALAHAGHLVLPVCPLGDDEAGQWLVKELQSHGVDLSQILHVEGPSTRSLVMTDNRGERTIVNLTRAREAEPPERIQDIAADCLYVRSKALNLAPLMAAQARDRLVVAHMPPWETGSRPAQVLVASASDLTPEILAAPFQTGLRVAGEILEWVIITHGAKGVIAYGRDQQLNIAAPRVEAVDSTGAGDSFAAGMIHALLNGKPMIQALETGCRWGAEATQWESSMLPAEAIEQLTVDA